MSNKPFKTISGSVCAPLGFKAGSVFCDVKRLGTGKGSAKGKKKDLAVIYSDVPAAVGGMFTTNQVVAAPVTYCIPIAKGSTAQAIVVNSGNANACTGKQGWTDAVTMADTTGQLLNIPANQVLVCSTGRIGLCLPMKNVKSGIKQAVQCAERSDSASKESAIAIMTSDTHPKEIAVEFSIQGKKVRLGGMTKGAGMIHPGMSPSGKNPISMPLHATMLCFITSDCHIDHKVWKSAIKQATSNTFNKISVDGDMSTNDSVIGLANGLAQNKKITSLKSEDGHILMQAIHYVCLELAKMMVRDGEGVTKLVKLKITGARNHKEADLAARAVANSELVKTSWFGEDPNWGRIAHALGYSQAKVDINTLDIGYSKIDKPSISYAIKAGTPTKTKLETLRKICQLSEFEIHCNLNQGDAQSHFFTSDLSEEYVDFNKGE